MIDVAHHGHDRRARHERRRIVGAVEHAFLDVGFGDALDAVAQFLGDELGGVGVDHVVDRRHLALLHQNLDDVDRALGHPVGKFLDGDRFRDRHFTNQLFFRLVALFRGAALHAAAERGFRALAHFVGAHGGDQRQPAARPLGRGLGGAGRTLRRRGRAHGAAGTAPEFRGFVFFRFDHGPCAGTGGRFALAEALLGDLVGLFLGDFVVLAALVFLALARLGGLALGLFDGVALLANLRLFFGDLAFLGLAQAGIAERVGAAVALFIGQGAQHHAGRLGRGGGRSGCGRRRCSGGRRRLGGRRCGRRALGDRCGRRSRGLGLAVGANGAALLDLDDHLLAAAMTEALAHHARLSAALERQRGLHAQRLAIRGLGVGHSVLESLSVRFAADVAPPAAVAPARKRSRRAYRAKNVSFAGPASRAACTTFDRPNAKSNWAVVKALMTVTGAVSPRRRSAPDSLATPSVPASVAWIRPTMVSWAMAASTLANPAVTSPAFPCDGERIERAPHQEALGLFNQLRRDAELALEAAREDVAGHSVLERGFLARDPQSAARQLALEIGHHAVRPDHEADQLVDRLHRAGQGAQPLGAGTAFARSGVELVVGRACQHRCDVRYAGVASASAGSASAAGCARSASVIQPALRRACMIIASASSREIS